MSSPDPTPTEHPVETIDFDEVSSQIEANQRARDELWEPSPNIEHLLWQVCGAWETVVEQVRGLKYSLCQRPPTEPPFIRPQAARVHKDMRKLAKAVNLRLPNDSNWAEECERARAIRNHLGHMLHFKAIEGEPPDQVVRLSRVPYFEPDELSIHGEEEQDLEPGEDDNRMEVAAHKRIEVTITADEARVVLADLKRVYNCIRAIERFGIQFNTWPDSKPVGDALDLLPWWCAEWGPERGEDGWSMPAMRDLRRVPKVDFDASLPEKMRPQF